jgi:TetR/AcrR family transcriptional regulator
MMAAKGDLMAVVTDNSKPKPRRRRSRGAQSIDGTADTQLAKPRQRDAVGTQERILAAAQAEFARKGYDGARIDAIVARAKVSKNLIYHYFGSKERLYILVLERTYEKLRRKQDDLPLHGLDPIAGMRALCEATFQVFIEEPEIIVMLNTENLYRGRHIAKSPTIRMLYDRLASSINEVLKDGVAKGVFRPGLDPIDLYISMSGLGYFYLSNSYTLSMLFKRDLKQARYLEQRKDHIVDMILRYICCDNAIRQD